MEAWIHFNASVRNAVWFRARWKKIFQGACSSPRLQYLRDYGVLPLLIANPWISFLYHSQFYVLYWHSSSLLYRFVVCFFVCHVCLRVTMTSSMQDNITGYFPRAPIWIGNFFVYHTCKYGRITYKYVIIRDYYMTFFISALVSVRDSHVNPDSEAGGLTWVEGWYQGRYGKFHVIIYWSHILHWLFSSIDIYIAEKIFKLANCGNKSLRELPLFNLQIFLFRVLYNDVRKCL